MRAVLAALFAIASIGFVLNLADGNWFAAVACAGGFWGFGWLLISLPKANATVDRILDESLEDEDK